MKATYVKRHPLLICFIFLCARLHAMHTGDDDEDKEWVTILKNVDGVLIESDPDSVGELPQVQSSYYQSDENREYKLYETIVDKDKEYIITKFVKDTDLTKLIIKYSTSKIGERGKIVCLLNLIAPVAKEHSEK